MVWFQVSQTTVSCPDYFSAHGKKNSLVNGYSVFLLSTTMVTLQPDCFM